MDREPQDTRPLAPAGDADGSAPPLREFSPEDEAAVKADNAPWSKFIARILRPASATFADERD